MLTLRKIDIENFGPFLGTQTMVFPTGGVTVVYGENGRGKTSLLNAISYALYGKVLMRGARSRPLRSISNRERAKSGEWGFKVVLSFTHDGEDYELTRACDRRQGVDEPKTDSDYEEKVLLKAGRKLLGPDERDARLRHVLPFDIARFFLFDGELLQEYEQLLIDDSDLGERLSKEIERILGVPILQKARLHLNQLASEALAAVEREARKSKKTEDMATTLTTFRETRDLRQNELESLVADLAELERERSQHEGFLRGQERNAKLLAERDLKQSVFDQSVATVAQEQQYLRELMADAWRGVLAPAAQAALDEAQAKAKDALGEVEMALRTDAVKAGACVICERALTDADKVRLGATLPDGVDMNAANALSGASTALGVVSSLATFTGANHDDDIRRTWDRIEDARLQQHEAADRIGEIEALLDPAVPDQLRTSQMSISTLSEKIAMHKQKIEETREIIQGLEPQIARLVKDIEAAGTGEFSSVNTRADLLGDSARIFEAAIEGYKADLRQRVEADATRFFLKMISEKEDYDRLVINQSYGLQIVHKDGRFEEARSAGQEHVVALSLMAALQANAPIQGPIVMDSPFGRLDEVHTANVIETLPTMVDQAALLVYRSEVDQDEMRQRLQEKLLKEYSLDRVSSRHTNITELTW